MVASNFCGQVSSHRESWRSFPRFITFRETNSLAFSLPPPIKGGRKLRKLEVAGFAQLSVVAKAKAAKTAKADFEGGFTVGFWVSFRHPPPWIAWLKLRERLPAFRPKSHRAGPGFPI